MKSDRKIGRRATNLSLDSTLVAEARELGLNLSRIAEEGLEQAVKAEREKRWKEQNREAIEAHNQYVREHGLPLAKYRLF
ncbi:MAG: type II toxin-antitoxin system CcdA family antitoxin [Nitratireductor sp.]|nr:type II toxin-antitoxin system CcdA family antitoxin [Nitratireductor sp.]